MSSTVGVIITGTTSGLGRSLALHLLKRPDVCCVVATGRRAQLLKSLVEEAGPGQKLVPVVSDITSDQGIQAIVDAVDAAAAKNPVTSWHLVHNAGTLGTVNSIKDGGAADILNALNVNVAAPVMLTAKLLPKLQQAGSRILCIGSGAAHHPYPSWVSYCASKSGLHMAHQVMRAEFQGKPAVASCRPGIIDTPMQEEIRGLDPQKFPMHQKFVEYKETGALEPPERVARFLEYLLFTVDKDQFNQSDEYDIRDEKLTALWD